MRLKYILFLAYKSLKSKKMRTFLTISGIAVGIGAIVFLVSVGYGLQNLVVSQVASMDEMKYIDVSPGSNNVIKLDDKARDGIGQLNNVSEVEPWASTAVKIKNNSSVVEGVVNGENTRLIAISDLKPEFGRVYQDNASGEVMINRAVLSLLSITNPEKILNQKMSFDLIITTDLLNEGEDKITKENKEYTVVGILSSKETPQVYLPLDQLKKEGVKNYSGLKVKIKNQNQMSDTRKQIENMGFKTSYVGDTVSQLNQSFNLLKGILAAFGIIALLVASIGMFNTLTISLLERIREIGLLKALGARDEVVTRLFLIESLIISLGGGLMGIILAFLLGKGLNLLLNFAASRTNNPPVTIFSTPWYFVVLMVIFSFLVGFLTGTYPARRAAKINPLDALRYE